MKQIFTGLYLRESAFCLISIFLYAFINKIDCYFILIEIIFADYCFFFFYFVSSSHQYMPHPVQCVSGNNTNSSADDDYDS